MMRIFGNPELLGDGFRNRQCEAEPCTTACGIVDPDPLVMCLYEGLRDGKSKTGARVIVPAGEETEDLCATICGHARSMVADRYFNSFLV